MLSTDENWFWKLRVWAGERLSCVFVCFLCVLLFLLSMCVVFVFNRFSKPADETFILAHVSLEMFFDDFWCESSLLSAAPAESRIFSNELCCWLESVLAPSPWVPTGLSDSRASPICWMRKSVYFFGVGLARKLYLDSVDLDVPVGLFVPAWVFFMCLVLWCGVGRPMSSTCCGHWSDFTTGSGYSLITLVKTDKDLIKAWAKRW